MTSFEEEYNKRLRRVAGIDDDSLRVEVTSGVGEGYWEGGCETCEYYNEGDPFVRVTVFEDYSIVSTKEYYDMGQLIREMDKIEL